MKTSILLISLILSGCSTAKKTEHGIPNFSVVDPGRVYRGGQPTAEGLQWLNSQGVKYIVKLNLEPEGTNWDSGPAFVTDGKSEGFAQSRVTYWCGGPCFEVSFIPISFDEQIIGPVPEWKIAHAVNQAKCLPNSVEGIADGKAGSKVFIHCLHGEDRTGLVVACYRVKVQGWTKEAAEAEMLKMGFHKSEAALWAFWKQTNPDMKWKVIRE